MKNKSDAFNIHFTFNLTSWKLVSSEIFSWKSTQSGFSVYLVAIFWHEKRSPKQVPFAAEEEISFPKGNTTHSVSLLELPDLWPCKHVARPYVNGIPLAARTLKKTNGDQSTKPELMSHLTSLEQMHFASSFPHWQHKDCCVIEAQFALCSPAENLSQHRVVFYWIQWRILQIIYTYKRKNDLGQSSMILKSDDSMPIDDIIMI